MKHQLFFMELKLPEKKRILKQYYVIILTDCGIIFKKLMGKYQRDSLSQIKPPKTL